MRKLVTESYYRALRNLQRSMNETQMNLVRVQGCQRELATLFSNQAERLSGTDQDEKGLSWDYGVVSELLTQSADAYSQLSSIVNNSVCCHPQSFFFL